MVAWLARPDETCQLWAALWDGLSWGAPELLGEAIAGDPPAIAAMSDKFVAVWSRAAHDESLDSTSWQLAEAWHDGTGWSALSPLPEFLFEEPLANKTPADAGGSGDTVEEAEAYDGNTVEVYSPGVVDEGMKTNPEECCEGKARERVNPKASVSATPVKASCRRRPARPNAKAVMMPGADGRRGSE